jgi:hypothetical protein
MEKHLGWLGWSVRDRVTGFTGVVATIGVDLYGCVQGIVTPPVVEDKGSGIQKLEDSRWFDLTRLERMGNAPVMTRIVPRAENVPGGYDKPVR